MELSFTDFLKQDRDRNSNTQQKPQEKMVDESVYDERELTKYKSRKNVRQLDEDYDNDDYYNESDEYEEDETNTDTEYDDVEGDFYDKPKHTERYAPTPTIKKPMKPIHKAYQRPQQPIQKPVVSKPTYTTKTAGYALPPDQFNRPISINKKQLAENTIEGTANSLTEAIKRKVDTVFYRFGIQGLEKLDEKILDTIEELQYPESRRLTEMRRIPPKKPIKRQRPIPLQNIAPIPKQEPIVEEPMVEEENEEFFVEEKPIVKEKPIQSEPRPIVQPKIQKKVVPQQPPRQEIVEEYDSNNSIFDFDDSNVPTQTIKESTSYGDELDNIVAEANMLDYAEPPKKKETTEEEDEAFWEAANAILATEPKNEYKPELPERISNLPTENVVQEEVVEEVAEPTQEPIVEETVVEEPPVVEEKPVKQRKTRKKKSVSEGTKTNEEK